MEWWAWSPQNSCRGWQCGNCYIFQFILWMEYEAGVPTIYILYIDHRYRRIFLDVIHYMYCLFMHVFLHVFYFFRINNKEAEFPWPCDRRKHQVLSPAPKSCQRYIEIQLPKCQKFSFSQIDKGKAVVSMRGRTFSFFWFVERLALHDF